MTPLRFAALIVVASIGLWLVRPERTWTVMRLFNAFVTGQLYDAARDTEKPYCGGGMSC